MLPSTIAGMLGDDLYLVEPRVGPSRALRRGKGKIVPRSLR
jgi:hypothetical protein